MNLQYPPSLPLIGLINRFFLLTNNQFRPVRGLHKTMYVGVESSCLLSSLHGDRKSGVGVLVSMYVLFLVSLYIVIVYTVLHQNKKGVEIQACRNQDFVYNNRAI